MKQKLLNIDSQADNDRMQVITIMRKILNHEIRTGRGSLESMRIDV